MKKAGHQCRFHCGRDACNGVILSTPTALLMHDQYPADGTKGFFGQICSFFLRGSIELWFWDQIVCVCANLQFAVKHKLLWSQQPICKRCHPPPILQKNLFLGPWGSLGTPSFICLFVRPSAPKYLKRRFSFLNHPRIMPDPKYDILPKRGQCLLLYGDTDQSGHTILAKSMFHSRGPF